MSKRIANYPTITGISDSDGHAIEAGDRVRFIKFTRGWTHSYTKPGTYPASKVVHRVIGWELVTDPDVTEVFGGLVYFNINRAAFMIQFDDGVREDAPLGDVREEAGMPRCRLTVLPHRLADLVLCMLREAPDNMLAIPGFAFKVRQRCALHMMPYEASQVADTLEELERRSNVLLLKNPAREYAAVQSYPVEAREDDRSR